MNREPIEQFTTAEAVTDAVDISHRPITGNANATANATATASEAPASEAKTSQVTEHSIGELIRQVCKLTPHQVQQVLSYQREHQVLFGEAAVALKLATSDDVMWALSQQFRYPFTTAKRQALNPELVVAREPFSEQAELFRAVRSQMARKLAALPQRAALCIVSPDVGDGKSYFAANLAIAFAQLGRKTLLVDADLRTPRQHQLFGIDQPSGLSAALSGRPAKVVRPLEDLPSLHVVPAGTMPPNPLELVEHSGFALLMTRLIGQFDQVIVDTPALTHGADAAVIAARCGTALAIARQGSSRVAALQDLVNLLRDDAVHVLGMLVSQH